MAFKKVVKEEKVVVKEVEKVEPKVVVPEFDPSIPENKQRWLRQ